MTAMDYIWMAACIVVILPPLAIGVTVLLFGDIMIAYMDSRKEEKKNCRG